MIAKKAFFVGMAAIFAVLSTGGCATNTGLSNSQGCIGVGTHCNCGTFVGKAVCDNGTLKCNCGGGTAGASGQTAPVAGTDSVSAGGTFDRGGSPVGGASGAKAGGGAGGTVGNKGGAGGAGTAGKGTGGAGTAGKGGDLGTGSTLPPVTDYTAVGPFATKTFDGSGPDGSYTMYQPTTLGENGFLHPILTWGNGITTTPQMYPGLLGNIASHGFVVIASDSSSVTSDLMTAGLDWLIQQNDLSSSEYYKKLDTSRAVSMGYSLGGGAALTTGAHKNVITTIAMHPAPGRGALHGPVLLFTGTADTIVPSTMVDMSYSALTVPTFYANLTGATHLEPMYTGGNELGPSVAWLRLWVYNDTGAKDFFDGNNCKLCVDPWTYQTKNWQ